MNKLEFSIVSIRDNLHQVEGFIENMVETFELKEGIRGKGGNDVFLKLITQNMMKKIVLVMVLLCVGAAIGYLYRDYHSVKQEEGKRVRKQSEYVSTPRNVYYTGEEDWENLIYQEYDDFGPV